jgi:hypothetical protein
MSAEYVAEAGNAAGQLRGPTLPIVGRPQPRHGRQRLRYESGDKVRHRCALPADRLGCRCPAR